MEIVITGISEPDARSEVIQRLRDRIVPEAVRVLVALDCGEAYVKIVPSASDGSTLRYIDATISDASVVPGYPEDALGLLAMVILLSLAELVSENTPHYEAIRVVLDLPGDMHGAFWDNPNTVDYSNLALQCPVTALRTRDMRLALALSTEGSRAFWADMMTRAQACHKMMVHQLLVRGTA